MSQTEDEKHLLALSSRLFTQQVDLNWAEAKQQKTIMILCETVSKYH